MKTLVMIARERVSFSHLLIDGRSLCEYDPSGKAAGEIEKLRNSLREELGL